MLTVLIGLHIIVSIALIVIVLLQMGKGAQAGASFGAGGSQAMFGSTGGNFMSKVTAGAAIISCLPVYPSLTFTVHLLPKLLCQVRSLHLFLANPLPQIKNNEILY